MGVLTNHVSAVFVRADVTRESDVAAVIAHAVERHGRLDSLVNCAEVTGFVGGVADAEQAPAVEDHRRGTRNRAEHGSPFPTGDHPRPRPPCR